MWSNLRDILRGKAIAGQGVERSPASARKSMSRRSFLGYAAGLAASRGMLPFLSDDLLWTPKENPDYVVPDQGDSLPCEWLFRDRAKEAARPEIDGSGLFLTFDDGPVFCTSDILDILREKGCKATFFFIGRNLNNPQLKKLAIRAVQEGHDVGNHSYNHPAFSTISVKKAEKEILSTHDLLEEVFSAAGTDSKTRDLFFRFPYGAVGSKSHYNACQEILAELGYRISWWNVDTNDWQMGLYWIPRSSFAVLASLKKARPTDVVLLHDRIKTANLLPKMLNLLESKRLVSATLSHYPSDFETPLLDRFLMGRSSSRKEGQPHILDGTLVKTRHSGKFDCNGLW
jgi:peptidoglycan/xylan/chitin deacetylase (PgdA/CDA1 family)